MSTKRANDRSGKRRSAPISPTGGILLAFGKSRSNIHTTYSIRQSAGIRHSIAIATKGCYATFKRRDIGSVGKVRRYKIAIDGGHTQRRLIASRDARRAARNSLTERMVLMPVWAPVRVSGWPSPWRRTAPAARVCARLRQPAGARSSSHRRVPQDR